MVLSGRSLGTISQVEKLGPRERKSLARRLLEAGASDQLPRGPVYVCVCGLLLLCPSTVLSLWPGGGTFRTLTARRDLGAGVGVLSCVAAQGHLTSVS